MHSRGNRKRLLFPTECSFGGSSTRINVQLPYAVSTTISSNPRIRVAPHCIPIFGCENLVDHVSFASIAKGLFRSLAFYVCNSSAPIRPSAELQARSLWNTVGSLHLERPSKSELSQREYFLTSSADSISKRDFNEASWASDLNLHALLGLTDTYKPTARTHSQMRR